MSYLEGGDERTGGSPEGKLLEIELGSLFEVIDCLFDRTTLAYRPHFGAFGDEEIVFSKDDCGIGLLFHSSSPETIIPQWRDSAGK